jgi:glycosyltransferase involved in cell wall biosynthesis
MKVGFLGNTNNYPFIIASQMREMGCEVVLYIDAPANETLHRPEHYTSDIKFPYPDWIKEELSLRNSLFTHFPNIFLKKIIKELNTCDAVVLNDYGHRFKNFIKPTIPSISMFSGADLEIMADYDNVRSMKMTNPKLRLVPAFIKKAYADLSVDQLRKGISKASMVSYFPKGLIPYGDRFLDEIFNNKPYHRFNHLHVDPNGLDYYPPAYNNVFRIFSFTRFMWKTPFPPGRSMLENKGNDIMIKGIALFFQKYKLQLDIHFVEKGLHIEETKQLIQELGIADMVTWHKEMPFTQLQDHIKKADVVIEQLGTHFISGGFFAMLRGRPVIGNARPEIFNAVTGEQSPVCHATTPEEVCYWLQQLTSDRSLRESIGKKSRQYVLDHFDIINETKYFKNFLEELVTKKNV